MGGRVRVTARLVEHSRVGVALLLVFAFGLSWWGGSRGFHPSDSNILFDGGWRILSGQIPYKDFVAPVIVPMYLQAIFFKIFGVNFNAYRLHAAVVNMVATGLSLIVLRGLLPARPWLWGTGALFTAVWFYPFWGTPWYYQSSVFFGLIGVACVLRARKLCLHETSGSRLPQALGFAMSSAPFFVLSFLSKQTSGGLFMVFPLLLWLTPPWPRKPGYLLLGYGFALLASSMAVIALVAHFADWSLFKYHVFELPPTNMAHVLSRQYYLSKSSGLLLLMALSVLLPVALRLWFVSERRRDIFLPLVCFAAISVFHEINIALSTSPAFGSLSLLGIQIVLGYYLLDEICLSLTSFRWQSQGLFQGLRGGYIGMMWLVFLAGLFLVQSGRWKTGPSAILAQPIVSGPLSGLRWPETIVPMNRQNVIDALDFVCHTRESVYIWGSMTLFYGVSGKASIPPVLWYHEGNCFPSTYDARMREIDLWTLRKIQQANPRYVMGNEPLMFFNPHPYFKETVRYLQNHYALKHQRFGPWLTLFERKDNV